MDRFMNQTNTIATVLFTYLRVEHTKKVLDALRDNYECPSILYIFQDGLKDEKDKEKWNKVNQLIHKYDFCPTEIIVSNYNKGLATSITEGLDYVCNRHESFVVLEDDCVPDKNFMGYMKGALEFYKNIREMYCVSGYSFPVEIDSDKDVYFAGRTCSWGWGTWSDRWKAFSRDKGLINNIQSNKEKSRILSLYGQDLPIMLKDNMNGKNDSWAVYWSLYVIDQGGYCIYPRVSLIQNIGMDGSGVHCGETNVFEVKNRNEKNKLFSYPTVYKMNEELSTFFMELYGGYTARNIDENNKHIIIYGLGQYYFRNERFFSERYFIEAFIDRNREGYYAGKKIIKIENLNEYKDCIVLILLIDINEALRIKKMIEEKTDLPEESILVLGKNNLLF